MPNLNDAFSTFLKNIEVPSDIVEYINKAKTTVRDYLASELEVFARSQGGDQSKITPRFFIQGSWAYKTLNYPDQAPPQNMDVDIGAYLPVSYLENKRPSIAAKEFFAEVDLLLGRLAELNHWKVDRSKNTCTRLILNDRVHFDVPLYSIPDDDFRELTVAAHKRGLIKDVAGFHDTISDDHVEIWSALPVNRVMLALRDGDWQESDPRQIHRWFEKELLAKGEQLRRVCRYAKAWRDRLWERGGPSSIFLMVLCSQLFKAFDERDDLAFLEVLKQLPMALLIPVIIPDYDGKDLSERQEPEDLKLLGVQALRFSQVLSDAINLDDSDGILQKKLLGHLGLRFPA